MNFRAENDLIIERKESDKSSLGSIHSTEGEVQHIETKELVRSVQSLHYFNWNMTMHKHYIVFIIMYILFPTATMQILHGELRVSKRYQT